MIRIAFNELEPGMVLAAPIRHPARSGHVLLHADFQLDADTIRRLQRFGIRRVWIRHPGFDFLDERLSEVVPQSRVKLYMGVKRSFSGIAERSSGAFSLLEYRKMVSDAIIAMVGDKNNAVQAERIMEGESELFAHSANVAYLALVIGMRLREYVCAERKHISRVEAEDLTNLGVGALLHDLGKLGLNERLQGVHSCDDQAGSEEYRTHPRRGYRAVQDRVEATARSAILHHHQRFDGQGFPQLPPLPGRKEALPMEGRNIHVFARIVAVANVLDELMAAHQKQDRPIVAALAALQREPFQGMFDPVVLDATLRSVPPFPLGTRVGLSDGGDAVVTDLNAAAPCQPKVHRTRPTVAEQGDVYEEIDLTAPGTPCIVSDGNRPVAQYLFAPAQLSRSQCRSR